MTDELLKISGKGNFIVTAPHTIYLKRGKEVHLPENNLKIILKKILKKLGEKNVKTITWNMEPDKKKTIHDDPNYLYHKKLETNIWYQTLKNITQNKPKKFLIDIHGMNNTHKYDIIIGLKSLHKLYGEYQYRKILSVIIEFFENFKEKYDLRIGYNIIFKGYISKDYYTISHISNSLGIKGIQMELSTLFREKLVKDKYIFRDFSKCLLNIYSKFCNKKVNSKKNVRLNKNKNSQKSSKSKKSKK